ncbi:unnamed protein product [Trifolium pratense]|uniref:Uncharacterized protein n=1 Tax=Trifolium pratense TaxID=57577 RepID=A0ACB0K6Y9_TRIPR|nr:unnamed protein product [Trifolium pratense]
MRCTEESKLTLGTYVLREEANKWWKNAKLRMGIGGVVITWEMFKGEFLRKYFPADIRNKKVVEFMELKQGNMFVAEYSVKFEELCAFSPHYNTVEAENDKCVKFEKCQKTDKKLMEKLAIVVEEGKEANFKVDENGVVRFHGRVCVPDVPEMKKMILEEGHRSGMSIHPGVTKMYQDLKKLFWWPGMKRQISEFVYACLVCQKSKIEHQKPSGLLQPLFIPEWKWDSIAMDFVGGLPKTTKGYEVIWVVVDRLTKCAHFIAIKKGTLVPKLAEIYVEQIVKLHGIPSSIVSDRDPRFTSRFWESLQEALGTKLRLSSAYHPQTDGQSERTIQSLEDLLRACVLEQGVSWDSCLPLIEFTYNNSFHSSIGMAPFEALYGRRVTSTTGIGRALKSRKLTSKFIGPYQILKRVGKVAYRIALPPSLANLHDVFHVSQLRKYVRDPSHVIESDDVQVRDDLTVETVPLRIDGREVKRLRNKDIASVKSVKLGMMKLTNPFLENIKECQKTDKKLMEKLAIVVEEGKEANFKVDENGVVRFHGRVCVPDVPEMKKMILEEGHRSGMSIHPGVTKMYQDLKKLFWWPGMKRQISEFVYACLVCQKSKIEHQKPSGLLQPLFIPEWKWDSIAMDFVGGLPKTTKGYEVIWVVVDRLTKCAHFIAIKKGTLVPKLAEIYVEQIVKLHGIPSSIVSDRDPRFTSRFWESLQEALGTKLRLSSAYHPQTDGQSERTIQSLEDLLRACVLEQGVSWDSCLPLIEFTYNNSFHSSIGMAPFEALYGRRCRTPLCWFESGESMILGPEIVQETTEKIRMIREKMKASQIEEVDVEVYWSLSDFEKSGESGV